MTWDYNYRKMGNALRINLVNNPDLALNPATGAKILVYGMINGTFTARKLSKYINTSKTDFYNARRVVNGTDKATLIKNYTLQLLNTYRSL